MRARHASTARDVNRSDARMAGLMRARAKRSEIVVSYFRLSQCPPNRNEYQDDPPYPWYTLIIR
eukprot:6204173-Pleurochrysis_carterae.AAC.4